MASRPIYEIHAKLENYNGDLWRRIQVSDNVPMSKLAYILMTSFEMTAQHLFSFIIPILENMKSDNDFNIISKNYVGKPNMQLQLINEYGDDYIEQTSKLLDAREITLKTALSKVGDKANFYYDYGDDWILALKVEKIFTDEVLDGKLLPRIIEGEGYGIVENCGGTYGLEAIKEAFGMKCGEDYLDFVDWLGVTHFDLEYLDIDDLNYRLKKLPRIYANIYEKGIYPTEKSIALIERDYLD